MKTVELVPQGPLLEQLIYEVAIESRPLENLSVIEAAEKYVYLKNYGSYVGPFQGDYAPYMIEPTNLLSSKEFISLVFCGSVQSGKALDVTTPMLTLSGWSTMGDLKKGDVIFTPQGLPTTVTAVTPYQYDRECYEVVFSDGSSLVADADHQWSVKDINRKKYEILTTKQMIDRGVRVRRQSRFSLPQTHPVRTPYDPSEVFRMKRKTFISETMSSKRQKSNQTKCLRVVSITEVTSRPVKCIQVAAKERTYLAGEALVPTHNTQMFPSWLTYTAKTDPADMMLVQMTQAAATDFTTRKIDRLHRDSPAVGELVMPGSASDSQFRKIYRNGMILTISWPSPTELASKSIPRVFLTDYDRMPMDVGGEGSPFDLAQKRTTTFKRNAMTVAESTPSMPVTNARWSVSKERPHEAPPCDGILGLYNRGDRRRWNWKCVSCELPFEPDFDLLKWPDSTDLLECAEQAYLTCPHCGQIYEHAGSDDAPGKNEMNRKNARWLIEGQRWLREGDVVGTPTRSKIASYWLKGVAARFQSWETMVFEYLKAEEHFESTGDETALQVNVNTRQGHPYKPKALEALRLPEDLKDRARDYGIREVPEGVRFLVAAIDVQKNRFVVQVHGVGVGGDIWVIDRFDIKKSNRPDEEAGGSLWVSPGSYSEDWDLLVEEVLIKSYPLADQSGRHMPIKITLCDSGGQAGVTKNAYEFYRRLRRPPSAEERKEGEIEIPQGLANRFWLVAGRPAIGAPRIRTSYPDAQRKDRFAGARGEIPLLLLHSDTLKNQLNNALDRTEPYGGRINFANWLDHNFYVELTVEIKNEKGKWENPKNFRNESWDLLTYCFAACIHSTVDIERSNFWSDPPGWAKSWNENDLVFNPDDASPIVAKPRKGYDFEKLGSEVA